MRADDFIKALGSSYFVGVPDSQLRSFCDYLMVEYGVDAEHHVIAANEGNCVALAAGHYLTTGEVPVVYMQNSGEGNIVNPLASLLDPEVYAIPELFVIGWRGEPGVKDEPQHIKQGKVTLPMLELMGVEATVITEETTLAQVEATMRHYRDCFSEGKSCAFVVSAGALESCTKAVYENPYVMSRESAIEIISQYASQDPVVCTTGKASRELFELREKEHQGHHRDFLTVGSMGHSSSIALGVASALKGQRVWCIDGDGALLMHMGALATVGTSGITNLVHVVINNGAHETVGGMPTVASGIDLTGIACACGYQMAETVEDEASLRNALESIVQGPAFIEVRCKLGSRKNLGRPTTTPVENRRAFEEYVREIKD